MPTQIRKRDLIFPGDSSETRWIKVGNLPKRPAAVRKLYEDFAVVKEGRYLCPVSFDRLTPSWYLNDSDDPNVCCVDGYDFRALRDIEPGEELSVDSSTYSQHAPFKFDRPGRDLSNDKKRPILRKSDRTGSLAPLTQGANEFLICPPPRNPVRNSADSWLCLCTR